MNPSPLVAEVDLNKSITTKKEELKNQASQMTKKEESNQTVTESDNSSSARKTDNEVKLNI